MANAQNKEAVFAIERACIGNSSVVIEGGKLTVNNAYSGNYNNGYSVVKGLVLYLTNDTPFDVTQILVKLEDRKTHAEKKYLINVFSPPLPTGAYISGMAEPALAQIIKSGSSTEILVAMSDLEVNMNDFEKHYIWNITPTKGIPAQ